MKIIENFYNLKLSLIISVIFLIIKGDSKVSKHNKEDGFNSAPMDQPT